MVGALLYLRSVSLRNRITGSVKRLRQPKYLISAFAGAAYFYLMIFRRIFLAAPGRSGLPGAPGMATPLLTPDAVLLLASALLFLYMLGQFAFAWYSPAAQPRLKFSEAEIAFLFPAPMTRVQLIVFNLLSAQFTILLSSLMLTVLFNRFSFLGGHVLARAVGWWLILSTVSLQSTHNQLTVARQIERGGPGVRRRVLGVIVLVVGALGYSLWQQARPAADGDLRGFNEMAAYVTRLLDSGLAHWFLLPFKWVAGPFAAGSLRDFALAIGPAVAIPLLFGFAIVRLEVSFAEGSIAQAERRTQVRSAWRAGNFPTRGKMKAIRAPFVLRDRGRPEMAFFWKNLIAIQAWFNLRVLLRVLAVLGAIAALNLQTHRQHSGHLAPLVLAGAAVVTFYTLLAGPQLFRQDLRSDLANADILKTYPLAGWQVVLGEILTPALVLSGVLWLTLLAAGWAWMSLTGPAGVVGPAAQTTLIGCTAAVVPLVVLLQLLIPNGAALLFPAWHQASRSRGAGPEAVGQRLIFVFGQLFAVILALVPAGLLGLLLYLATYWWIGLPVAIVFTALGIAVVITGELCVGMWWLGTRFERLDIALELRP